jgi:hypothetical protein
MNSTQVKITWASNLYVYMMNQNEVIRASLSITNAFLTRP